MSLLQIGDTHYCCFTTVAVAVASLSFGEENYEENGN